MKTLELQMPSDLAQMIRETADQEGLERLETNFLRKVGTVPAFLKQPPWQRFVEAVSSAWKARHHLVVRGIPTDNGATTLLAALSLSSDFKPYRGEKIVKHFKMSPWTEELSQTIKEGHFHTDVNTAPTPPAATVIHCLKADPDPKMGVSRVVLLQELLAELQARGAHDTLTFMTQTQLDMVDERKQGSWFGPIVEGDTIRFHPETLRAAAKRLNSLPGDLETHLAMIHSSALAVSEPIYLDTGDALFVSNKRALHYRGACTAQFIKFPRQFLSREIYVLHLQAEPQWQH